MNRDTGVLQRLVSRGTACSAMDRSISSDSAALQTLGLRVLAFSRMCSATSRSADS